jgi:hypothetical protein
MKRTVFDVEGEVQVSCGGNAYMNQVGFQGAEDLKASLTLVLPSFVSGQPDVIAEFEGSALLRIDMLIESLNAIEAVLKVTKKSAGQSVNFHAPTATHR